MINRLLNLSASVACRAPGTTLLIATVLAVVSIVYAALALQLNADTDDLIARDRPFIDDYLGFLEEFGDLEYLYVVIEHDDHERAQEAVEYLGPRLREIDLLPDVYFTIDPAEQLRLATRAMSAEELRDFVQPADAHALLRVASDAPAVLESANDALQRLIRQGVEMSAEEQERLAASAVLLLRSIAAADPDSSSAREMAYLLSHELEREYLRSESGQLYFLIISPVKDYGTLAVIEEPLRLIREAIAETRERYPDLEIGLTGKPVLQADEMSTTDRDMQRAATLAIILVAILFMIVIGGVWHPLLGVVALLYGIALTFGLTTLVIGQLNLLSIVFTLVLVGVGIDFGVHLVARYKEELRHHHIDEAIAIALTTAGRGNVTGAITSSVAFFTTMLTDFQGLRELGFIAGTGLLLCLLSMCLVLPAFLALLDRWRTRHSKKASPPPLPEKTSLEDRIWRGLVAHPGKVLLGGILVTAIISPGFWRIGFEANLLELQAVGLESVEWERRILDDSAETWFGAVIVESQEEVLDVVDRAESHEWIGGTQSIFDVIRPDSPERETLRDRLQARAGTDRDDPDRDAAEDNASGPLRSADLREPANTLEILARGAERQSPEDAAMLRSLRSDLMALSNQLLEADDPERQALNERMNASVRTIGKSIDRIVEGDAMALRDALPHAMRDRFISPRGRYLVKLHPTENVWDYEPMERFVRAIREIDPTVTGVPITQFESFNDMQRAFAQAAIYAFVAIFLLLWLDQRQLRNAVTAILPLVIAMVWLTALMGIAGVRFNLANFFAVPILIGIGVDSGIHIMRRYQEGGPLRLELGSTRRAVFLTAMTSLIGFGMLATASHLGLRSLGFVMVLGCLATLGSTLIILPAILAWREQRTGTLG